MYTSIDVVLVTDSFLSWFHNAYRYRKNEINYLIETTLQRYSIHQFRNGTFKVCVTAIDKLSIYISVADIRTANKS